MLVAESGLKFSCLCSPGERKPDGSKVRNKVYAQKSVLSSEALNLRTSCFFFFSLLTESVGNKLPDGLRHSACLPVTGGQSDTWCHQCSGGSSVCAQQWDTLYPVPLSMLRGCTGTIPGAAQDQELSRRRHRPAHGTAAP